jgi:hypothetical protein
MSTAPAFGASLAASLRADLVLLLISISSGLHGLKWQWMSGVWMAANAQLQSPFAALSLCLRIGFIRTASHLFGRML